MRIKLICLEDGTTASGFRRMTAYAQQMDPETGTYYVSTQRYRSMRGVLTGRVGGVGELNDEEVDEVATALTGADVIGFSSMTGYADLTRRIITRVRQLDPSAYLIWGGIHPIIHPEDALTADVDAICTGEGEFAFEELIARLEDGRDPRDVLNLWFKDRHGQIQRNMFRPLQTAEEMETLPYPQYGDGELLYRAGEGFAPMELRDYLANDGLSYTTLWSIGCPFHCTFCGNTKFIANDPKYKKLRHPSARHMVGEVKRVRARFPHVSQVSFHDDSFMAIPYPELEEFAELWRSELGIPFAVYGVIPNYVKREKFDILTWAGMNRVRMGVQSGSQRILDFYRRPSPPAKILEAAEVAASYAPRYHIAPAYDIIMDNPIETRQDVVDTLELFYEMHRPYTLLVYSLKVIPNTQLEADMRELGIDLEAISSSFHIVPPRMANLVIYLLAIVHPPRWLFDRLLRRVEASTTPQRLYPRLGMLLRITYTMKRVVRHVRHMDFSTIPGWPGYVFWRLGIVTFWQRRLTPRPPRPHASHQRPLADIEILPQSIPLHETA